MKNKTLGIGMITPCVIFILTMIFESSMSYEVAENLYAIAGIGFVLFGVWGGVRLVEIGEK